MAVVTDEKIIQIKAIILNIVANNFGNSFLEMRSLYTDIIEPLGYEAKNKNDEYNLSLSKMINRFTQDFSSEFCNDQGEILWEKLVQYNSSKIISKSNLK